MAYISKYGSAKNVKLLVYTKAPISIAVTEDVKGKMRAQEMKLKKGMTMVVIPIKHRDALVECLKQYDEVVRVKEEIIFDDK